MEETKKTDSEFGFEYLDHTADIQFHTWGPSLNVAFEQALLAMFNYMVELSSVEIDSSVEPRVYEAEGHDLESLLFKVMDEFLFIFSTEFFVCKKVNIIEFDKENFRIKALGEGEIFNKKKHIPGTEIKAITYSNMQIIEHENKAEIYVIVDI